MVLQTQQQSKPRAIPTLIALWTAIIFFVFLLAPAYRESAPITALLFILLSFGGIWAVVGTIWLRKTAVRLTIAVLIGYPLLVIAKALVTGYSSYWLFGLLSFIAMINALCVWYLLRSGVRAFWSPGGTIPAAQAGQ